MNGNIRLKLFIMMFLEFFIWGAWLPKIFGHIAALGFSPAQQSWILNAFPIAAILAMFLSNQFADRYFAAERFLAVSHLIGGIAILGLAWVDTFWPFFILMAIHCLVYVPTISITNSIAFAAMRDAQQEFGIVRMGGTIGWIAASWPFIFLLRGVEEPQEVLRATSWIYVVAGVASLALAAYSMTLPHTPPKPGKSLGDSLAWVKATKVLFLPFVFVLWLVTFIDATVHNLYFNWTDRFLGAIGISPNLTMVVMSIGQVAEIFTMIVLGLFLKRLGWKLTMIIGILGHAGRFSVFAFFPENTALVVAVNVLHGICYAFFFATVYIFVDEYFPKDVRSSAQGLFNLMILGIGPMVANYFGPWLYDQHTTPIRETNDFQGLFLIPVYAALAAAALLAVAFWPPGKKAAEVVDEPTPYVPPQVSEV
jgi:nucleoside transporter